MNNRCKFINRGILLKTKLQHIGEQLLPVIAYGDAAGLPVETRSAAEIVEEYGYIDSLQVTEDNPYFSGIYEPGMWSDDTQLSIAVIRGIMKAHGFDMGEIAEAHVVEYRRTPTVCRDGKYRKRGWGKGTEQSVHRIMSGMSPYRSGSPVSSGNGVVMKLAPLAYWQYARGVEDRARYEQYDQLTSMTHNNDIARICTRVHGDVLCRLLQTGDMAEIGEFAISRSLKHEDDFGGSNTETSTTLEYLANWEPNHEDILTQTDGKGFYVPQTLAMTYGSFLLNAGTFADVIYGAVNLGGDTDSIASIAGTMELFARGKIELPNDYELIHDKAQLEELSSSFAIAAISST